MKELQEKLLSMLKWFHNFCIENDLKYYAVGGTALGAVRHKGFIPWDDDVDIGMPREDYEKFKILSSKFEEKNQYLAEFPSDVKDFVYPYGKLYDTTTTLIEHTRYNTKRGIYIDVFPIDGIGNTKGESIKNFKKVDNWVNLLSTRVCAMRKGRKVYKNIAVLFVKCVPDFILGQKKIMSKIEKLSKKHNYYESEYVANLVGNWHQKEIQKRTTLGKPKLCDFEDVQIYIPENTDEYLTQLYGDYMKLPPKEKQVSHHDYILLDLNASYFD